MRNDVTKRVALITSLTGLTEEEASLTKLTEEKEPLLLPVSIAVSIVSIAVWDRRPQRLTNCYYAIGIGLPLVVTYAIGSTVPTKACIHSTGIQRERSIIFQK